MRLMTIFNLATKPERELHAAFQEAVAQALENEPGSLERHEATATLANLAIALQLLRRPTP
jgi:hypothetical protein